MLGNRDLSNIGGLIDERLACLQSLDQITAHGRSDHKAITGASYCIERLRSGLTPYTLC